MTPEKRTIVEHWLKELETPCKPMTEWELGFLESVTDQLERKGHLSERQVEIVERIYAEKTA